MLHPKEAAATNGKTQGLRHLMERAELSSGKTLGIQWMEILTQTMIGMKEMLLLMETQILPQRAQNGLGKAMGMETMKMATLQPHWSKRRHTGLVNMMDIKPAY
jgi:hypothetical protein